MKIDLFRRETRSVLLIRATNITYHRRPDVFDIFSVDLYGIVDLETNIFGILFVEFGHKIYDLLAINIFFQAIIFSFKKMCYLNLY